VACTAHQKATNNQNGHDGAASLFLLLAAHLLAHFVGSSDRHGDHGIHDYHEYGWDEEHEEQVAVALVDADVQLCSMGIYRFQISWFETTTWFVRS